MLLPFEMFSGLLQYWSISSSELMKIRFSLRAVQRCFRTLLVLKPCRKSVVKHVKFHLKITAACFNSCSLLFWPQMRDLHLHKFCKLSVSLKFLSVLLLSKSSTILSFLLWMILLFCCFNFYFSFIVLKIWELEHE